MRITAILASHNRLDQTLNCLTTYYAQDAFTEAIPSAVLVDAGSVDGTPEAVRERFPHTKVIARDGSVFWAGGMAIAERVALKQNPDFLLWLNDDVCLDADALTRLIATVAGHGNPCIAVGALRDPSTGELTYSGARRRGLHPLRMELVAPVSEPIEVDTFDGNVVLVPRAASRRIGCIDGELVHAAADYDYGLRARKAGVVNLLAPSTVGTCALNPLRQPWLDQSISRWQRLRLLIGPKGVPPRPRARYLRRHGGRAWLVFWLANYVRNVLSILRGTDSTTTRMCQAEREDQRGEH